MIASPRDVFALPLSHLLHEDDEDLPEDLDEVDEEVEGMGDEVPVPAAPLLDDHLGVPDDEPAEEEETAPQIDLEDKKKGKKLKDFFFACTLLDPFYGRK